MIFLIDDKEKRQQEDFGWSKEKLKQNNQFIQPIYTADELEERSNEIFQVGNIVIYHESFLDSTSKAKNASDKRNELEKFAKNNQPFYLAIFSGSKNSRVLNENIAHLPVSIVYKNLDLFKQKFLEGDSNLKYLLFGENPEIEELLSNKLDNANSEIDKQPADASLFKNLFLRPAIGYIQKAIENADEEVLFKDVSDDKLSQNVTKWLSEKEYDNIFIPLCFGKTLSDYNGLRLACHIRCSDTPNQLKNIIIYSFVNLEYLLDNEYFNILKSKNVQIVEYKKKAFQKAAYSQREILTIEELTQEISKLKLDPPKNYEDNHSTTNEWAIYQWSISIGAEKNIELEKIFKTVENNLYFKYLKTINPISKNTVIPKKQLKIDNHGDPRVLLIDDESGKGWGEIFAYLLGDLNNVWSDDIGDGFKKLSQEEIVKQSIQKVKDDDIDVVILDFRLNTKDFSNPNIEDVTSIKLLRAIKELNPGIQVIIFSATTKIWNLQALQNAGADDFVFKDIGENINRTIATLVRTLITCLEKAPWLKSIHTSFVEIQKNAIDLSQQFTSNLKINLLISFDLLDMSFQEKKYINYAYLQLFICIEDFLRQKKIFEYGDKCYVNQIIKVAEKQNKNTWSSILKYNEPTSNNPSYFSYGEDERTFNITTDFKMSAVLIFMFNQADSNGFNWPAIRDTRNKKAAHPEKSIVTKNEIQTLLNFMEIIFNSSKIQISDKEGLNDEIDENTLDSLRKQFADKSEDRTRI